MGKKKKHQVTSLWWLFIAMNTFMCVAAAWIALVTDFHAKRPIFKLTATILVLWMTAGRLVFLLSFFSSYWGIEYSERVEHVSADVLNACLMTTTTTTRNDKTPHPQQHGHHARDWRTMEAHLDRIHGVSTWEGCVSSWPFFFSVRTHYYNSPSNDDDDDAVQEERTS